MSIMKNRLNRRAARGLLGGSAAAKAGLTPVHRPAHAGFENYQATTDARWKSFYDTMAGAGVLTRGLDARKAYSLEFVNKGSGA
jgi:hypothetical protein